MTSLLAGGADRVVQRHQLTLEQLDRIEEDPEVFPVQRVHVNTDSAEYARVMAEKHRLDAAIAPVTGQLATRGLFKRKEHNKVARHIGKAYQGGLLKQPTAIVEVRTQQIPNLMPAALNLTPVPDLTAGNSWFYWEGWTERWLQKPQNWAGGYESLGREIGIRDVAVGDNQLLRSVLVHEGTHGFQHLANVEQGNDPFEWFKREFRAYWQGSRFVSGQVVGLGARDDTDRARIIKEFIVGAGPEAATLYANVRNWYWGSDQARQQVDDYRLDAATWWVTNLHVQKMLTGDLDDAGLLREWRKLTTSEQRAIRTDEEVQLNGRLLKFVIRNRLDDAESSLYRTLS